MAKVVDSVEGLLWGTYIGSPSESEPIVIWKARQETPISRLVSVTSNEIYGVPKFSTVAVLYNREEGNASSKNPSAVSGSFLIQWNHPGLSNNSIFQFVFLYKKISYCGIILFSCFLSSLQLPRLGQRP